MNRLSVFTAQHCTLVNTRVHRRLASSVSNINSRFWSRRVQISGCKTLEDLSERLCEAGIDIPSVVSGTVTFPTINLVFPVSFGNIQYQNKIHIIDSNRNTKPDATIIDVVKCINDGVVAIVTSCSPRLNLLANPEDIPSEREINSERRTALDALLFEKFNITARELSSEEMLGTPPYRVYRSFIAPKKGNHTLLPTEKQISLAASQIEFAMKQFRADKQASLRNYDNNTPDQQMQAPQVAKFPIVLILDNVRSALNVGGIFRTAETAGLAEVVTVGITAHPPNPKLMKTALMSTNFVNHRHFEDIASAVNTLRTEGYQIVVMETTSKSEVYTKCNYASKVALVLGNEVIGVDTKLYDTADKLIEIPTYGIKNSLNVVSAAATVVYEIIRQRMQ